MRKTPLIFVLTIFICGCASYVDYLFKNSPQSSIDYDADLKGLSKRSIARKCGEPSSKQVSLGYDQRIDKWTYYRNSKKDMHIVFTNGYVSEVFYE